MLRVAWQLVTNLSGQNIGPKFLYKSFDLEGGTVTVGSPDILKNQLPIKRNIPDERRCQPGATSLEWCGL